MEVGIGDYWAKGRNKIDELQIRPRMGQMYIVISLSVKGTTPRGVDWNSYLNYLKTFNPFVITMEL